MRVYIVGGAEGQASRIATALVRDGIVVAGADAPFDLILTLGEPPHRLTVGELVIDLIARRVARNGRPIRLTPREFDLVAALARAGGPLDRAALIDCVWGYAHDPGTNLVAVHIARLREKIGRAAIQWSKAGYRLDPA